jgi:hypothetical protein
MTTIELVWCISLSVVIAQNCILIAVARGRAEAQERRIQALEKKLGGTK